MKRKLGLIWLGLALVVVGCDTGASERLTLPDVDVAFRFEIDGSALTDGQPYTAVSTNTVDLTEALQQRGGIQNVKWWLRL